MIIKIKRVAKEHGVAKAFIVQIDNRKFPREHGGWYFCPTRENAIEMALFDWKLLRNFIGEHNAKY